MIYLLMFNYIMLIIYIIVYQYIYIYDVLLYIYIFDALHILYISKLEEIYIYIRHSMLNYCKDFIYKIHLKIIN